MALLCVALMAVTSFAAMASAGGMEGEVGGMLDGTKPGEDQALAFFGAPDQEHHP